MSGESSTPSVKILAAYLSVPLRKAATCGMMIGMEPHTGLSKYNIIGFFTIVDVARAKRFYGDTLGLRLISEEPPFALVFDANGIMLRLGMGKELPPASGTVLGWQVTEIESVVQNLKTAGVRFEHYEFLKQDDS